MSIFLETDPSNFSVVSNDSFHEIAETIIKDNAEPAFWFYAVGGMVLITLASINVVTRSPRGNGVLFYLVRKS